MDVNNKKKFLIWASIGGLPLFLMTFALFISVFLVLGLFESKVSDSSNGNVAFDSDCNYEETMVTVMDGSNTRILATVSLKDYIIGVACVEIGACGGASSSISEHYVKSQYVASKTYVLSSRGYNSSTKSITVRASTRNQQWCDLKNGCIVTKESNSIYHNTYPGNYDESQINGSIIARRSFTEKDIEVFNQYYTDTYGDLFLDTNYNKSITSLGSKDAVYYKASTQNFWNSQAKNGKIYDEILKNTATSGASDSSHYVGKSVYKLGSYCKSTSGSGVASGDMDYLSGGLPIPVYYQQDYADVSLSSGRTVSSSGCGFTSSSMVVSYLTGKKITPREFVGDWSRKYYVKGVGMNHGLPSAASQHYGLGNVETTTSSSRMVQALKDGHPVMSSQGIGLFTRGGHLIVLRGVTSDGKILVNDPNKTNAVTRGYNNRAFTVAEIDKANKKYFIWPKKK